MKKSEFLDELRGRLFSLPPEDIAQSIAFWSEMIDDRMEDGMSEEDAVRAVGTPAEAAAQILGEAPAVKPATLHKRPLRAWEIVLLILGSPIWLSLLIAAFTVVLSLYITVWAVVISLWAAAIAITVSALPVMAYGAFLTVIQGVGSGLLWIGTSLILFGTGLFLISLCLLITKAICSLTACIFRKKKHNEEKGI